MAPYPMAKAPTFRELRDRLQKEFDCEIRNDPNGCEYIERHLNGKVLTYPLAYEDLDDRIGLWVVKSICRRLKIESSNFGLTLE